MPLLDPQVSAQIGVLQSLDDAIAYRLDRLSQPCPDCRPAARCADHRQDEHLIGRYQARYAAALRDTLAGIDPADVALIMQPGGTDPTAGALSLVVMARLRELAASGPVLADLDGSPAIYETDGPAIIEHPLQPASDDN